MEKNVRKKSKTVLMKRYNEEIYLKKFKVIIVSIKLDYNEMLFFSNIYF